MRSKDIFDYINMFFNIYLKSEIGASDDTISSYHDAFKLLFKYIISECDFKLINFSFKYFTKDFVLSFLYWLENNRKNSISTRNLRYEAIRTFCNYVIQFEFENINLIQITKIPRKKRCKEKLVVMSEKQVELLLQQPDYKTKKGRRELAMLSLLYDSGVRISELLNLKIKNITFDGIKTIQVIKGKGNKNRTIPISDDTAYILKIYIEDYQKNLDDYLFTNSRNERLCTNAVRKIINKYCNKAKQIDSEFLNHIYPHLFRHSKATHLINKGVSITEVKEELGHANLSSTQLYITTDILKKRDALKTIESQIIDDKNIISVHSDEDIFKWLDELNIR